MSDIYIQVKKGGGGLPVTGQTTSYRAYDDGGIQAGIPNAGRFIDNGDGTITDTATNLMWRKWSMGMDQTTGSGSAGTYSWNAAVSFNGNAHAGHSDWRLPNGLELISIANMNAGDGAPYIYKTYFPGTISSAYWTATTHPNATTYGKTVLFQEGSLSALQKSQSTYVRLVRQI